MTTRPLHGVRVAVTRAADVHCALSALLEAAGANVMRVPLVTVVTDADSTALRDAAMRLAGYDWIVFTSARAVHVLADAVERTGARDPGARIGAVGSATAAAIETRLGWRVDVMPLRASASALAAEMLASEPMHDARVLWPRARDVATDLGALLTAQGALVDAPEAYRSMPSATGALRIASLLDAGDDIDVVTFTSPAAVRALQSVRSRAPGVVAVIGRTTAAAVRSAGWTVGVEAAEATFESLTDALETWVARRS